MGCPPAARTRALERGEDGVDLIPRLPVGKPGGEGKGLVPLQGEQGQADARQCSSSALKPAAPMRHALWEVMGAAADGS